MSQSEVERFAKDLKTNPALQEEAKKHAGSKAAKKQQKMNKKAAKKQRKAMKKSAKAQRKADKKANRSYR